MGTKVTRFASPTTLTAIHLAKVEEPQLAPELDKRKFVIDLLVKQILEAATYSHDPLWAGAAYEYADDHRIGSSAELMRKSHKVELPAMVNPDGVLAQVMWHKEWAGDFFGVP